MAVGVFGRWSGSRTRTGSLGRRRASRRSTCRATPPSPRCGTRWSSRSSAWPSCDPQPRPLFARHCPSPHTVRLPNAGHRLSSSRRPALHNKTRVCIHVIARVFSLATQAVAAQSLGGSPVHPCLRVGPPVCRQSRQTKPVSSLSSARSSHPSKYSKQH